MTTSATTRFGISHSQYKKYLEEHAKNLSTKPDLGEGVDGMVFYDWEAAALARTFEKMRDDLEVCGVIASMMNYVNLKDSIAG